MTARADVLIVGAGPAGLFAAFQLGLFGIRSQLADSRDGPGGQCSELYPDKPIYDVPGQPGVEAQALVAGLMRQLEPVGAQFCFGTTVASLAPLTAGFRAETATGKHLEAAAVVLATGAGKLPTATGLERRDGAALVDPATFGASMPGVFAIGDACSYPGKLPLLVSAFHEAALMTQAVRQLLNPNVRATLKYTSASASLKRRLGAV